MILLDLLMPIMDGLEATKVLRTKPVFSKTPIIALTASAGEESREDSLNAGCTDHISKPIQSIELFEILNKHMKQNH